MHPPSAAWAIIQCVLRAEAASIMRAGAADGDAQVVEGRMENYATLRSPCDDPSIRSGTWSVAYVRYQAPSG